MTLVATRLRTGYGRRVVGECVDLQLGEGDVICLLGANGCGKTTLFRSLLGLLAPLGGDITLDGQPLHRLRRRDVARRIAYVPQSHLPPFPYRVMDVVLMGTAVDTDPFRQPGPAQRQTAHGVLERLGLERLANADYSKLSGGQRQLVLIARAMAQRAALLIMDEPASGLDFGNQAKILSEVVSLARDPTGHRIGVLLSTHDPHHAFALGATVWLMRRGAIENRGPADEVLTAENLTRIYGVPVRVERTGSGNRLFTGA